MSHAFNWITTSPVKVPLPLLPLANGFISPLASSLFTNLEWISRGALVVSSKDVISIPSFSLSDSQVSQLKEAAKDPLKLVQIRAKADKDSSDVTYASVRACALYESSLSDLISVYFDSSGSFMGASVTSTNPSCISTIMDAPAKKFNTTVEVLTTALGPVPDTQTYLQRLEQEKQEKLRGDKQDNRSFLAKYVSIY